MRNWLVWAVDNLARVPAGERVLGAAAGLGSGASAPIFMLHRVLEDTSAAYDAEMAVSLDNFERLLVWVTRHYTVVRLKDLRKELTRARRGAPPLCALTFDDGWVDNFTNAFPRLQRHNLTATIFLAVNFIGTSRRFWQERLRRYLRQAGPANEAAASLRTASSQLAWHPPLGLADLSPRRLRQRLLERPSTEAEAFVERLGQIVGATPEGESPAFMNWDQVRHMSEAGIDFGSHTLNHTLMTRAPALVAQEEAAGSRGAIAERLGAAVCGFAYPWGAMSPASRAQVESAGYGFAVTTAPGLARAGHDPLALPRVALSDSCFGPPPRRGGLPAEKRAGGSFSAAALSLHIARARLSPARLAPYR